jgi:nucleotide-binding universal stress UspA family protein
MTRKILVPLDGSMDSEAVLVAARDLAESWGPATLHLLHVAPPTESVVVDGRVVSYADQETERARWQALAYLDRVAAPLAGLDIATEVRFGDPDAAIVEVAREAGVDCIAMATAVTTVRSVLNLSVAERVLRASGLPVLLVHESAWQTAPVD